MPALVNTPNAYDIEVCFDPSHVPSLHDPEALMRFDLDVAIEKLTRALVPDLLMQVARSRANASHIVVVRLGAEISVSTRLARHEPYERPSA